MSSVAAEEVGILRGSVVIEAVATQRASRLSKDDILTGLYKLRVSIVISPRTSEVYAASLAHMDMTEGLKGVAHLIKISTVARQLRVVIAETHISLSHLDIGFDELVGRKDIRMVEIDLTVALRFLALRPGGQSQRKHKKAQNHLKDDSVPSVKISYCITKKRHLIQPSYSKSHPS